MKTFKKIWKIFPISKKVQKKIEFHFVDKMTDVLKLAIEKYGIEGYSEG